MNKLKVFEKKLLFHRFLFDSANSVTDLFFTFLIFDQTGSLAKILIFKLWQFIFIPIGALFSDFCTNRIGPIKTYILSILINIIYVSLIISFRESAVNYLIILGVLNGLVIGSRALPWNVLFQDKVTDENRGRFGGVRRSLDGIRSIILPAICAFYIGGGGSYLILFISSVFLYILSVVSIFTLRPDKFISKPIRLLESLRNYVTNRDLKLLLRATFMIGLRSSILVSIWDIVALTLIGGMTSWGVYKTIFGIVTVILSYIIGNKLNLLRSRFGASLSAIAFFLGMTVLALNFNLQGFLIYSLAAAFFNASFWNSLDIIRAQIIKRNIFDDGLVDETKFIKEIPLCIGRVIPIFILLETNASFEENFVLRIIILVVGIMPFIVYLILSKSSVVKQADNPFWQ